MDTKRTIEEINKTGKSKVTPQKKIKNIAEGVNEGIAKDFKKTKEKVTEEETNKAVELFGKWKKNGKLSKSDANSIYTYLDTHGIQYLPDSVPGTEMEGLYQWLSNFYMDKYYSAPDFDRIGVNDEGPTAENLKRFRSLNTILENIDFKNINAKK